MDLRPINPYYQQKKTSKKRARSRAPSSGTAFAYPHVWVQPVTDRTQADIDRAKRLIAGGWQAMTDAEKQEYLSGLKGCMNSSDFERIENNVQILLDVLEIDAFSHVGNIPEFPKESYFADMKVNVALIRNGYGAHSDTPQVSELPYNDWQKYNDIEKILADVYETVSSQFHYYAGEIYAGEETGLLL